jgi:hypothetical protein
MVLTTCWDAAGPPEEEASPGGPQGALERRRLRGDPATKNHHRRPSLGISGIEGQRGVLTLGDDLPPAAPQGASAERGHPLIFLVDPGELPCSNRRDHPHGVSASAGVALSAHPEEGALRLYIDAWIDYLQARRGRRRYCHIDLFPDVIEAVPRLKLAPVVELASLEAPVVEVVL